MTVSSPELATSAEARAGDPAHPPSTARWVRVVAVLMVLGAVGVRWRLLAGRNYYGDDLLWLHLADTHSLFSPSYLFQDYQGHLMPGGFLLVGLVERIAPLEWWPTATALVTLQMLASLALLRLLRVLLGDRPLLLLPLAFGLFSPITLGSTTWLAAAVNSLPLQIGLAWFLADAVLLVRTGARRYAVQGTAVLAGTLLFFFKAAMLPWLAFPLVAILLYGAGVARPVRAAWQRGQGLWLGSLGVTAAWAAAYATTRSQAPTASRGSVEDVVMTVRTGFRMLAASAVGGPVDWGGERPAPPWASVPLALSVAGAVVLVLACAWTCRRRRGAAALWALLVGEAALGLVLAGVGRGALGLGDSVPLAGRYYAVEAVLLPAAVAVLAVLPARGGAAVGTAVRRRWAVVPLTGATVLFVVAGVASAADHGRAWGDRTGTYLATARTSLSTAGPAPMLDQQIPDDVMWNLAYPGNLVSRVFSPLDDRPPVRAWTDDLRVLDDEGDLRPARVEPGVSVIEGAVPGCGWSIAAGDGTAVDFSEDIIGWEWTAEVRYVADRDGTVVVELPLRGVPVRAPVQQGSNTLYLRLIGGGDALRITTVTTGLELCVNGGAMGHIALR